MSIAVSTKPRAYHQVNHSNVVTSVAFAPDGRHLVSGSWDGTVKLWDVSGEKPALARTYRGDWDEVDAVAFAPDGRAVAGLGTGFDGAPYGVVTLWPLDVSRGRQLLRMTGKIDAMAFSPDGATLATGSGDRRAVTLHDVATGAERATLADHSGPIWSVDYAPDGQTLAVASGVVPGVAGQDGAVKLGEVRLWDLSRKAPRERARLEGHEYGAVSLTFAPDGRRLATGGFDRTVKLWDVKSGRDTATLAGHDGWVAAVAFAPDGATLATGSHDHTVKIWDVLTGRELRTLTGHTGNVYTVAFAPDGSRVASGSLDGTVRLWDLGRV